MHRSTSATLLVLSLLLPVTSQAQTYDQKQFNVVGTFNFLTNYPQLEIPFFTEVLPQLSGGKLTANMKAYNELNHKGPEMLRLIKQGVFDFAFAIPIFVEDGGAVIEAIDIAGVSRNLQMARDITELWMPEMQSTKSLRDSPLCGMQEPMGHPD